MYLHNQIRLSLDTMPLAVPCHYSCVVSSHGGGANEQQSSNLRCSTDNEGVVYDEISESMIRQKGSTATELQDIQLKENTAYQLGMNRK
jgi:hypothetical protein